MMRIVVKSAPGSYPVVCARGLLRRGRFLERVLPGPAERYLISSPRVWRACCARIAHELAEGARGGPILFDDREAAKHLATVEKLCRRLVHAGADRDAVLVAIGGGVVGDVVGFVAACYLRGVRVVHVPTTLVAQADSSIGGKTGVNLREGKNLVGAFYPPRLVLVDPELLTSLEERQYRSGIYEVVKYGVLGDAELFAFLERQLDRLLRRDPRALGWVLPRCIRAKARVVSHDEREAGLRQTLNFGHTLAHALEAATRYRRFLHGEAVGWGMVAAAEIAREQSLLAPDDSRRIRELVERIGRLPRFPAERTARIFAAMQADKKARAGELRWVLPRGIGRVEIRTGIPLALVRKIVARLPELVPARRAGRGAFRR
jgi:3-dehydroquinate synthase